VVVDADALGVDERHRDLQSALQGEKLEPIALSDPIVVLIPKRQVETWIRATTGQPTNETDDYKSDQPGKDELRAAAQLIHGWAHDTPKPDHNCVSSLHMALPEWRKIG